MSPRRALSGQTHNELGAQASLPNQRSSAKLIDKRFIVGQLGEEAVDLSLIKVEYKHSQRTLTDTFYNHERLQCDYCEVVYELGFSDGNRPRLEVLLKEAKMSVNDAHPEHSLESLEFPSFRTERL